MESSDDDSFAWTTGSDSVSSEDSVKNMAKKHDSADESEYGKKYKKKLQKQLFSENGNVTSDSETPKKKAKKRKIKTEDEDKSKRSDCDSEDDSYLETRVKQEKKRSLSFSSNHCEPGSKKRKLDVDVKPEKSKKKKHVQEEHNESDAHSEYTNAEDKFTAEETVVQARSETKQTSRLSSSSQNTEAAAESSDNTSAKTKKNKRKSKVSESAQSDSSQPEHVANGFGGHAPNKISSKRKSRISDRIMFEDDNEPAESDHTSELSSRLEKYLKRNPNLQPLDHVLEKDATIGKDDEVWLLKFPQHVDISTLQHSSLTLDTKCKAKIAGSTYDGAVEDSDGRAIVVCLSHNKPLIRNIKLNTTVKFNKRIPKIHIVDNNIMLNQTNFIPLPDTKCRHPLFGSNYKKAIKLPSAVKSRLSEIEILSEEYNSFSEVKKKKKSKKQKEEVVEVEVPRVGKKRKHTASEESVEPAPESQPKHKRKKHKHSTDPVAWESEKAIEQNLFDF